jgi:rhodanese-related sulfurtransferase
MKLIPLPELEEKLDQLAAHRQRRIVAVRRTERRSVRAAELLSEKGFCHVFVLAGGMEEWT